MNAFHSYPPTVEPVRFLRMPEVCTYLGVGRTTIYAWIALGDFPKPHKLGRRAVAWPAREVAAWAASRKAA